MSLSEDACRAQVSARSGGLCELTGERAEHMSHRVSRGRFGGWTPSNILHLSGRVHGMLHARPEIAYAGGWFVESGADPQLVRVWLRSPFPAWWSVVDDPGDGGPHLIRLSLDQPVRPQFPWESAADYVAARVLV